MISSVTQAATVLAGGASIIVGQSAWAGLQFEVHQLLHDVQIADYDEHYSQVLNLPMFDTQGGTRQLEVFEYVYTFGFEYNITYHPNTSADDHYSFTTIRYEFQTTVNGEQFLPHADHPGQPDIPVVRENTFIESTPPDFPGFSFPMGGFGGPFGSMTDTAFLASVTGTGTIQILSEIWTFAPVIQNYDSYLLFNPDYADGPPPGVFDPNTVTRDLNFVYADVVVAYGYTTVPTPGAFTLFAIGGLVGRSRKRIR